MSGTNKRGKAKFFGLLRREVNIDERRITAYASTRDMDRYGTVFEPTAFQSGLAKYLKNPIVLGAHTHCYETGEPPVIGRVVNSAIDETGLLVEIEFAEGGMADVWWQRYRDGFMRALSVGVLINKFEERKRDDGSVYTAYTDVDLLEISCVGAPGNPFALVRSLIGEQDIDEIEREAKDFLGLAQAPSPARAAATAPAPASPSAPEPASAPAPEQRRAPAGDGLTATEIERLRAMLASAWEVREEMRALLASRKELEESLRRAEAALREEVRGVRRDVDAVLLSGGQRRKITQENIEPRGDAPKQGREARPLGFLGL